MVPGIGNDSDIASASARQSTATNGTTAANPNVAFGTIPAEAEIAAEKRVSFKSFIMAALAKSNTSFANGCAPEADTL